MIAIGSDHGGIKLKREIMDYLTQNSIEFKDFGTYTEESCNYPVYAKVVSEAVVSGECEKGILICGTGVGISMAANKIKGVRCALCSDCFTAEMTRLHNNSNILAMGERVLGAGLAIKITETFLNTGFEGGRHATRVDMIMELEK